jgi:hypothetical protein
MSKKGEIAELIGESLSLGRRSIETLNVGEKKSARLERQKSRT